MLLSDVKLSNYKERTAQVMAFLDKYIPDVAAMETQMKKYHKCFTTAEAEKAVLKAENESLTDELKKVSSRAPSRNCKMPSCKVITKRRRLFLNGFHRILSRHTHSGATGKGRLISIAHWNKDEWSGLADLLANQ